MSRLRTPAFLVAVALAVGISGCDPGYGYQPVDPGGQLLERWSVTVRGVQFTAEPYSTLIGSSNVILALDIANEANQEVIVLGGQFGTNGRTIDATIYDTPEGRDARMVPPRTSKAVTLFWPLGGAAAEVLGTDISWVWRVRIGTTEYDLRVPMRRTRA
jgi:hypothetical protein